jgi:hypothetical protein
MYEHRSLHRIEDDLEETWVEEWAAEGIAAIGVYLAKHLAFLAFLDDTGLLDDTALLDDAAAA